MIRFIMIQCIYFIKLQNTKTNKIIYYYYLSMEFSELILHETYRDFPMAFTFNNRDRPKKTYLNVKNIKLNQLTSNQRKHAIIRQKKQIRPHSQQSHNYRKSLIQRTQKLLKPKPQQTNTHQQYTTKKNNNNKFAIKGKVLSMSVNLKKSKYMNNSKENSQFEMENSENRHSRAYNNNLKQYLSVAIHKTMMVKKVEQEQPQVLSVRLSREKDYDKYRISNKNKLKKVGRWSEDKPERVIKPYVNNRYEANTGQRRASTSHNNYRNIRNRKNSQILQPW